MPETTEATDQPPKSRRRFRHLRLVGIGFCVFVLSTILIQRWKPWLNESERRMLGVWTWQDDPGDMIHEYRDDGTMRFLSDEPKDRVHFARWSIKRDKHIVEHSPQNLWRYMYLKQFYLRVKRNQGFGNEYATIDFRSDGTIPFTRDDGKKKVLIPWSSDMGDSLKQAE